MSKTIELTDQEYEFIHHALNNLTLSFEDSIMNGWIDGLQVVQLSFPYDDNGKETLTSKQAGDILTELVMNKFEM